MGWFSNFFNQDLINLIDRRFYVMTEALDTLTIEVSETKTVIESAITLIQGIKQKLDDAIAANNPAALAALSAELDTSTNALADAVAANTPTP